MRFEFESFQYDDDNGYINKYDREHQTMRRYIRSFVYIYVRLVELKYWVCRKLKKKQQIIILEKSIFY